MFTTSLALIINDQIRDEIAADQSRTSLFNDMGNIFALEIPQGGEDGIWSGLSQATQRAFHDLL